MRILSTEFFLMASMDDKVARFLKYQFPVIFWGLLIAVVSSIPKISQPIPSIPHADKAAHFLEYAVFAYLMCRALFYSAQPHHLSRPVIMAILFCAVFAAGDELHQLFIPGRSGSFSDFIADSLGILSALILFYFRHDKIASAGESS